MNIYLVDDNKVFRNNLKLYLEGHLKHKIVGESDSGKEFLSEQTITADLVLMDINMPEISGLQATKLSTWKKRDIIIVAVSQHKDSIDLQQLIGVGFKGFVSKTNLFRDLENAIEVVMEGGYFFPEELRIQSKKPL